MPTLREAQRGTGGTLVGPREKMWLAGVADVVERL